MRPIPAARLTAAICAHTAFGVLVLAIRRAVKRRLA